jgi:hypothetical protein
MFTRILDLWIVSVLVCAMALVPGAVSTHAQTLTPPPPPGAICQTTGSGIFCRGVINQSGTNVDTGIACGTFNVLQTYSARTTYELWYNPAGLGTQGTFHDDVTSTYINSVTGTTITANTHSTRVATFGVPGDRTTLTRTTTGAMNISTGTGFGLVTHDVGRLTLDSGFDVTFEAGPHDQIDNFAAFVDAVCSALA